PHLPSNTRCRVDRFRARLFTNHNLNQSHDMDWVEKVHTDNCVRAFGRTSYLSYGQRRSIASEYEGGVRRAFELPKNIFFQVEFLGGGLNNQICCGALLQVCCPANLLQSAVAIFFG